MFHVLAYEETQGINAAAAPLDAVGEDVFSKRNDNFIFSERWQVIGAYAAAASMTRARFDVPTWNAWGRNQIWPIERDADVPDDPSFLDLRDIPLDIPRDEEIEIETSNNLGAATEETTVILWLAQPGFNRVQPRGTHRFTARATIASFTTTARGWSGFQAMTFDETLRSGMYGVVGVAMMVAGPVAFKINFPRNPAIQGRLMRPGSLVQQLIGEKPISRDFPGGMWGQFHSFELPTVSVYSPAAAAIVPEMYWDLVLLGESR